MSPIKLFEECHRAFVEKRSHGESIYSYLNRSGRPEILKIRMLLNSWFSLLSDEQKESYYSRLTNRKNFNGAFYEMFLLALFKKAGFIIEIEPKLDASRKQPDFLLNKNSHCVIVEATSNECSLTSKITNFTIREQVVGELNDLDLHHVKLLIYDLRILVKQKPSIKSLKSELVKHCREIESTEYADHTFLTSDQHFFSYLDRDVIFKCAFFIDTTPKNQARKTVYADSYDIKIDPIVQQLNKSVKTKKSRYGKLERPFVICVNFPNRPLDQDEILSIMNPNERRDARFIGKRPHLSNFGRMIDDSISALFISHVTPFNLPDPQYWFIKNPNAEFPIDNSFLQIDLYEVEGANFVSKASNISISEFMGII